MPPDSDPRAYARRAARLGSTAGISGRDAVVDSSPLSGRGSAAGARSGARGTGSRAPDGARGRNPELFLDRVGRRALLNGDQNRCGASPPDRRRPDGRAELLGRAIDPRQVSRRLADVRPDAVIAQLSRVDGYAHAAGILPDRGASPRPPPPRLRRGSPKRLSREGGRTPTSGPMPRSAPAFAKAPAAAVALAEAGRRAPVARLSEPHDVSRRYTRSTGAQRGWCFS